MSSAKLLANCFRSSICFGPETWIFQENKVNIAVHDDVIKWKHFPRYRPFVREIYRSPVNSPHKGQWRGALMFSMICSWVNVWVNNGEAGDLRRHRAHYDVTVMRISRHGIDITGYEGACLPRGRISMIWWRHQLETCSALLALCEVIHRSLVDSLHKSQWRRALMISLICVWGNYWDAGDLRRHRVYYDVTVMDVGWGLLKRRSLISPLGKLSKFWKYLLESLNHIYIWQIKNGITTEWRELS